MRIPWFRSSFLIRRRLDRVVFDPPDFALRAFAGRSHWPPYSLRSFVGGADDFDSIGRWFIGEVRELGLLARGSRVLDVGCGCGRLAYALATDPAVRELGIRYAGMDVDRAVIEWCQRHIATVNPQFEFYHADCYNRSYNPKGSVAAKEYRFPHADSSFDLILLTSVLTHVLDEELVHYMAEISRLLSPGGAAYATLFLYQDEPVDRETPGGRIAFPYVRGACAVNREDQPANAVAYQEDFVRKTAGDAGLRLIDPIRYGIQDVAILCKARDQELELLEGWHALEDRCWRWTAREFSVRLRTSGRRAILRFRFTLQDSGPIRVKASVGGAWLPECEYESCGEQIYVQNIPGESGMDEFVTIRFELDRALPAGTDKRELGVQVAFWSYCGVTPRALGPIEIAD